MVEMRPFTYFLLIFCIAIAGYWTGNTNILMQLYSQQGNTTLSPIGNLTGFNSTALNNGTMTNQQYWANDTGGVWSQIWSHILIIVAISMSTALIVGVASIVAPGIGQSIGQSIGFAAFYIIPMVMALAIFNFVFMPNSWLLDATTPFEIRIPFVALTNGLLVWTIYSMGRGQS